MEELKLVFPKKEYREQIKEYLQEHIDNNEFELSGDGGLDKIQDFDQWLEKIKNDLSEETVENGRVPATLFLGVRKSDNKVIGTIQIRHRLNKSLLKNGGILENEISAENGKIDQRYWISLKKRYANRHKLNQPNSDLIYLVKSFKEDSFHGDVCYDNFKNADIKISTPEGKVIIDNDYKLLEFYDYNSKIKLSAFYDKNGEIIEWYFDIAKEIGKENGVPYEDDLYLDVVVNPNGEIMLLDEEELKEALKRFEITKEEYEMAYEEANQLIMLLKANKENLKDFTDKYLKYFEKNES